MIPTERVLAHFGYLVGANRKCKCLWHNDNEPSLHVYPDGLFCFVCGMSADIFDITEKFTGLTSFKEQAEYLTKKFMNSSLQSSYLPDKQKIQYSYDLAMTDEVATSRYRNAIKIVTNVTNIYTKSYLDRHHNIPVPYREFFENRFESIYCLLSYMHFFEENVLFLPSRRDVVTALKDQMPNDWQECGLFKSDGKLCQLYEWSFCLLFPVYTIQANEVVSTTMLIRNIDPNQKCKDFYFVTRDRSKQIAHEGYAGLKWAFNMYPENVRNFCDGLTVVLVEGTTDLISAHILCIKFNMFGGLNEKTVILTAGGVFNTTKESNLKLIKNCSRLIVAFDRDDAGDDGFKRVHVNASQLGLKNIERFKFIPNFKGKDLNDLLIAHKHRREI